MHQTGNIGCTHPRLLFTYAEPYIFLRTESGKTQKKETRAVLHENWAAATRFD